ncbi:MAG: hypothetical protein CL564_05975 [Alphaproteobacteria bacterium]|nr:hypothetical protein [Alphaproteobacteria bacterium]
MVQSTKKLLTKEKLKNVSLFKKVVYGLCPNCGSISIFKYYVTLLEVCPCCGHEINTQKIGDGAAWFAMFITSIVVAIGALLLEVNFQPKLWVHVVIWFPIVISLSVIILRPFKALLICISSEKNN